ncbi:MAG TPA: hypothetical protein PKL97_09730 [Candidatus Omnitrophota bacterium]|nr:hypothetical protein [Candidatus Omnitrophota bacterium]
MEEQKTDLDSEKENSSPAYQGEGKVYDYETLEEVQKVRSYSGVWPAIALLGTLALGLLLFAFFFVAFLYFFLPLFVILALAGFLRNLFRKN